MVELATLQAVSYIIGSLGVFVAAVYYILMVRINQRNMRITLTNSLIQKISTDAFLAKYIELGYMEWKDYDDFEKKYGSDEHPDNLVKRSSIFSAYDSLGLLLLKGLADRDTLYNSYTVYGSVYMWHKFKDVLEANRRLYSGMDAWKGFEYLANELLKMKKNRDPNYKVEMGDPRYDETKKRA